MHVYILQILHRIIYVSTYIDTHYFCIIFYLHDLFIFNEYYDYIFGEWG